MYSRWLYSCNNNPMKNIEVRRYACGHYYARGYITSTNGAYVLSILSFHRTKKNNLLELLENYTLLLSEVVQ